MKTIRVLDLYREFTFKTDSRDVGLDAVFMEEVNYKMHPIQWASKKLTSTEKKYGIT